MKHTARILLLTLGITAQSIFTLTAPQSGTITQTVYGTFGMPIPPFPDGTYPSYPITKVEWSVINTSGQRVVIQTLR